MGLLDGLLGSAMGGLLGRQQQGTQGAGAAGGGALIAMILAMLQQSGGLDGLLRKMQQSGYGDHAQSWIGTGANQPISPDALSQIFGQGQLGQIAQQLGMSHQEAADSVAQALPDVVNHMTPDGQIPDNSNELVAQALQILQNKNR